VENPPSYQPAASVPPEGPIPPPPFPPNGQPTTRDRLRTYTQHPQAAAIALAVLIGFASILSAVVAWQASLASIDASRLGSLGVQQRARVQQIERDLQGLIAQDLRFVNLYQEHALAARELRSQADELRATDANAADNLDLEAQSRDDLARAIKPFFLAAGGVTLSDDGTVVYDANYVLRNLESGTVELRELSTARTRELADRSDARSVSLGAVAAVIVAALFFLTVAQVARTRALTRRIFIVAGGFLVLVGTLSFLFIEFIA
jgi:hypothetical protein